MLIYWDLMMIGDLMGFNSDSTRIEWWFIYWDLMFNGGLMIFKWFHSDLLELNGM